MKNIPKKIYLQIGDDCPDDVDYLDLVGVTFHHERVNANDIEYEQSSEASPLETGEISRDPNYQT